MFFVFFFFLVGGLQWSSGVCNSVLNAGCTRKRKKTLPGYCLVAVIEYLPDILTAVTVNNMQLTQITMLGLTSATGSKLK